MSLDADALDRAAACAATPDGARLLRLARLRLTGVALDPAVADDAAAQAAVDVEIAALRARPELSALIPLLDEPDVAAPRAAAHRAAVGPRAISLWHPVEDRGALVFERPPPGPFGDHYASRRRIAAARPPGVRRVVFLGESVAAGYLYAPDHTPGGVLAATLAATGTAPIEVVDLARTDETLSGLVETAEEALQLAPDAFVCFAGNNWDLLERAGDGALAETIEGRQRAGLALRVLGFIGAAEVCAWSLCERVQAGLARLAAMGVPVIWVLPEVALATWHGLQPPMWIDDLAGWYARHAAACEAAAAGDHTTLRRLAEEMIRLDGGFNPTSLALLARAAAARGDAAGARRAALRHVDAASYGTHAILDAPRAGSMVRALIRRGCAHHGFALVDLPELFSQHGGGALPGWELFLDYCHLTAEGMALAMAACAGAVLTQLDGRAPPEDALIAHARSIRPTPAVEARAALGAAVHTAHRLVDVLGGTAALDHWLRRALDADPAVASQMEALLEARAAPCTAVLTRAQAAAMAGPAPLTLQHGWRWENIDADLCEALARALPPPARERLDERLATLRAAPEEGVDLADGSAWLWSPTLRFLRDVLEAADAPAAGYVRAVWPVTRFALAWDGEGGAALDLVVRVPRGEGRVEVRVNGSAVGEVRVGTSWARVRLVAPATSLRRGLNEVALRWPIPRRDPEEALREAADRLLTGLPAELHPTFGHVAALRVARAEGS